MTPHLLLLTIPNNAAPMRNGLGLILPRGAHLDLLTLILKRSTFRARKQASLGGIDDLPRFIMNIPWQQLTHIKINGRRVLTRDCLLLLARCHVELRYTYRQSNLDGLTMLHLQLSFPMFITPRSFFYPQFYYMSGINSRLETRRIREEHGVSLEHGFLDNGFRISGGISE